MSIDAAFRVRLVGGRFVETLIFGFSGFVVPTLAGQIEPVTLERQRQAGGVLSATAVAGVNARLPPAFGWATVVVGWIECRDPTHVSHWPANRPISEADLQRRGAPAASVKGSGRRRRTNVAL
jgi:hypothetical protein